jgi:hypothetical protein
MRCLPATGTMALREVQIASRKKLHRQGKRKNPSRSLPDEVDESDTDSTKVEKEPARAGSFLSRLAPYKAASESAAARMTAPDASPILRPPGERRPDDAMDVP